MADSLPFQDNEGRWCRSVHVTRNRCDECGRSGFHKHYLDPADDLAAIATVYVAGPMSGLRGYNYPAFRAAAAQLRAAAYVVLDPTSGAGDTLGAADHDWDWYLRRSLRMLTRAQGVALLPGWAASRGATLEVHVAEQLGMPCHPVEAWVAARGAE